MKYGRREFIKDGVIATAGIAAFSGGAGCSKAGAAQASPFTDSERACLVAMAEQIVPADEFGGATDAGVIFYFENWVTKYYPERLSFYKEGIDSVQKSANALHGKNFEALSFAEQTDFMKKMESNKLPKESWQGGSQPFFQEILDKTMQGYYGDPRHGGNKDYLSYRMMNLDVPLVIGQNRYANGK